MASPVPAPPLALVTGASRGLGAETARQLAARGTIVALMARSADRLDAVAAEIRATGGRARVLACDVADAAAVEDHIAELVAQDGPVTVLINNAGTIDPIAPLTTLHPTDFAQTVAVNLHGAFHAVHAVRRSMLSAGGGVVVNVSSGAAHRPLEGWTSYCVGKAGLWMLTQAMHAELGPLGIRTYGFQPGTVDTDMQASIRRSGINPVSRMRRDEHLPPSVPAACLTWLVHAAPAEWAGRDLRVDAVRARMAAEPA